MTDIDIPDFFKSSMPRVKQPSCVRVMDIIAQAKEAADRNGPYESASARDAYVRAILAIWLEEAERRIEALEQTPAFLRRQAG